MLRISRLASAVAAANGPRLKFAQLDELLHFLAALYDLERVLAADLLGLDTQEVAARAHAVKKARALDALLKAADKVHRAFAFVLLDFRIYHMPE